MWWSGPLAALMHHKPDMLLGWLNQYSFFSDDPTWPVVIYGFMAEGISYVALYMLRKSAAWNNPSAALRQAMEITGPRWAGPGAVALTQEAQLWPQLTVAQTFETLDGLRGFTEPPPHREQMLQACKTLLPPPNKFIDECTFSERELVLLVGALSQEADLILIHRHESYQLLPRSTRFPKTASTAILAPLRSLCASYLYEFYSRINAPVGNFFTPTALSTPLKRPLYLAP